MAEKKKSSRVKQVGALGIVGILALLLARLQCGPGLGVPGGDPGDPQPAVEAPEVDEEAQEELAPFVLTISGDNIADPSGNMLTPAQSATAAGEAVAEGREVHVVPAGDALDRAVHGLTGALDEAGTPYTIVPP